MAVTQNTYTGNGSSTNYSFTFPYLETTDIKVSLDGSITTAYTLANATTIEFDTAPANGVAIRIYRQTDDSGLAAQFYPGSAIRSQDLNDNFTQNLYVTQESNRDATAAVTTSDGATATANTALSTANTALSTANTAESNSTAAVATANTADTNASTAVATANTADTNASAAVVTADSAAADAATALSTANTALSTANTADTNASTALSTANTALADSAAAVTTANTASSNATTAVSTANTASTNATNAVSTANTAISTANAAASAVANAILYDTVANVAAIPASPANNDAVEVVDSTGIESFTPLSGVPAGFTGDSGLSVRMVYTTSGTTWNWIQYFPNDPENRYGGAITTLEGDVTTIQSDITQVQSDILGLDSSKLDVTTAATTYVANADIGVTVQAYDSTLLNDADIGVTVQAYDANLPAGNTILVDGDIGVTVQAYDATTLVYNDIGVTVQGYDSHYVRTNQAQTFGAPQRGGLVNIGSSASMTLNLSTGNNFYTTLDTSTSLTPANLTQGQHGVLVITQDGTGGHTMSFDSTFKFPGGAIPNLTTTAGAVDVLVYYVESAARITCRLINDVK
jgi:hypothetical protein